MLVADAAQVIQIEWQSAAVIGSAVGAAIVGAAKILAAQMSLHHTESRQDTREAREENRTLSTAILAIQRQTIETIALLQREIERGNRGDGSKAHSPVPH